MKLCFSIDALSPSGAKAWRLLENDSWRECIYAEALKDGDARITDKQSGEAWAGRRLKKDTDLGLIPQQKAGRFDFLMRGIFAHAVLHRTSSAPLPDKDQMIACFEQCIPGTAWLVFLNVSGQFQALDTGTVSILNNLDIAVRGEIASSEDYIGPKAAANEKMMNNHYHQFLAGWAEHLKSSNMNIFVPDIEKLKEETVYIERIQNWQSE
ncbi:MAG: hypothetical protein ACE5E3_06035 [Mariprofundus sp.]